MFKVKENLMLDKLKNILKRLEEAKIHYYFLHGTEDGMMFLITVPGQRWENKT